MAIETPTNATVNIATNGQNSRIQLSDNCYKLVKEFEGLRLEAYLCPAGVWTIGYGHTGTVDGKPITKGMRITAEQAEALLKQDLDRFRQHVQSYDHIYHWNQNELDALTSFAFNIGNIQQLTAKGTRTRGQITQKMLLYNKANNKVLPGLTRRRMAEAKLFATPVEEAEETLTVYLDDKEITLPRILVNGSNYVKLRDICKALGKSVEYRMGKVHIV